MRMKAVWDKLMETVKVSIFQVSFKPAVNK